MLYEEGTIICSCGATKYSQSLQNTVKRNILLLGKIEGYKPNISQLPYYQKGEIFVTVFLGGTPPTKTFYVI